MKLSEFWFGALAIAATVVLFHSSARADTYQIYDLGSAYRTDLSGITPSGGTVVLYSNVSNLYQTFVDGVSTGFTTARPSFTFDNGTPCTVSIGSSHATDAVCNNGREVFAYNPNHIGGSAFYDGTDLAADGAGGGDVFDAILNASGDFVLTEGETANDASGEIDEYVDLSTSPVPEPSGIVLLGTGMLGLAGLTRRRLFAKSATRS
ncbi:MAG TPA: PEP-CTERM sorting domain-containing protein [Acidobacteriaceae bacterium]|nr:PEP-CTERM sorting domain-containing protein [Acidobacteriaceae bacterium]